MKKLLRWGKALALLLLAAAILAAGVIVYRGYRMYRDAITAVPLADRIAQVQAVPNYTTLDELPEIYTDAVLSVEDRRFYLHPGVDPVAICRAVWIDLQTRSLAEGGSTITQQLAKNLYFTQEKRFERKVAEVFMAFALESACTKDEILELYINSIYYGSNYYTIYDAAMGYFGKTPAQLTDSECTLLAGLPNAPSAYSPDASPALAAARQSRVLQAMVENHKLTQEQADVIRAQAAAAE